MHSNIDVTDMHLMPLHVHVHAYLLVYMGGHACIEGLRHIRLPSLEVYSGRFGSVFFYASVYRVVYRFVVVYILERHVCIFTYSHIDMYIHALYIYMYVYMYTVLLHDHI